MNTVLKLVVKFLIHILVHNYFIWTIWSANMICSIQMYITWEVSTYLCPACSLCVCELSSDKLSRSRVQGHDLAANKAAYHQLQRAPRAWKNMGFVIDLFFFWVSHVWLLVYQKYEPHQTFANLSTNRIQRVHISGRASWQHQLAEIKHWPTADSRLKEQTGFNYFIQIHFTAYSGWNSIENGIGIHIQLPPLPSGCTNVVECCLPLWGDTAPSSHNLACVTGPCVLLGPLGSASVPQLAARACHHSLQILGDNPRAQKPPLRPLQK